MSTGSRYSNPFGYAYAPNGQPIPGALLYFYNGNSSTPADTYSDANITTPNSNPVVADSTGTYPSIFLHPAITYKVTETYPVVSGGATIWTAYPVASDASVLRAALAAPTGAALVGTSDGSNVQAQLTALPVVVAGYATAAASSASTALIAAATLGVYPNSAASNVPRGAAINVLTPGTGGTNGTNYVATYTGGNYIGNPTVLYDVVAGAVANVRLTDPGLYIGASPIAPTVVLGSGAGGAALTLTSVFRIGTGSGYWVQSADGLTLDRYKNVAGVATRDTAIESIAAAGYVTASTAFRLSSIVQGGEAARTGNSYPAQAVFTNAAIADIVVWDPRPIPTTGTLKSLFVGIRPSGGGTLVMVLAHRVSPTQLDIYKVIQTVVTEGTQTLVCVSDGGTLPDDIEVRAGDLFGFWYHGTGGWASISYSSGGDNVYRVTLDGCVVYSTASLPVTGTVTALYNGANITFAAELSIEAPAVSRKTRPMARSGIDVNFSAATCPFDVSPVGSGWTFPSNYAVFGGAPGIGTNALRAIPLVATHSQRLVGEFEFTTLGDAASASKCPFNPSSLGTLAAADAGANTFTLYQAFNNTGSYPAVQQSVTPSVTLTTGRRYRIEIVYSNKTITARLIDVTSAVAGAQTIATIGPVAPAGSGAMLNPSGQMNGLAELRCLAGAPRFYVLRNLVGVADPDVVIWGDSLSNSNSVTWAQGYQALLATALGPGRVLVSAIDGSDAISLRKRVQSDLNYMCFRPRFGVLMIGTNDTSYANWQPQYDTIIDLMLEAGVEPLLVALPPKNGSALQTGTLNPYISGKPYSVLRFDIAASLGGDGVTYDASKSPDGVHYNAATHAAWLARFQIDAPQLIDAYGAWS